MSDIKASVQDCYDFGGFNNCDTITTFTKMDCSSTNSTSWTCTSTEDTPTSVVVKVLWQE